MCMEQFERKFVVNTDGKTEINIPTEQEKTLYETRKVTERASALKENRERIAKLSPEDLAAEWIDDVLRVKSPYSETLLIETDGSVNTQTRADKIPPSLIVNGIILKTKEELYSHLYKISKKYPQYQFSFDLDKDGRWIKYTVIKI